jgi:hypothetical protein
MVCWGAGAAGGVDVAEDAGEEGGVADELAPGDPAAASEVAELSAAAALLSAAVAEVPAVAAESAVFHAESSTQVEGPAPRELLVAGLVGCKRDKSYFRTRLSRIAGSVGGKELGSVVLGVVVRMIEANG